MRGGYSLNTLPENHLGEHSKQRHSKDYHFNALVTELNLHRFQRQPHHKGVYSTALPEESPILSARTNNHHSLERTQILSRLLKSIEGDRYEARHGRIVGQFRRKKEQLLGDIQRKL